MNAIPIRLQLTTRSNPPVTPLDINTDLTPQLWRGEDIDVDIGIFNGNSVDLSNIDFLQVSIFPYPIAPKNVDTTYGYAPYTILPYPSTPPAPLLFRTISAASITPLINWADWLAGTAQQAKAQFTAIETASLSTGGAEFADFWMTVTALAGIRKLVYGGTPLRVFESGAQGIYLPNQIAPLFVPIYTTLLVQANQQLLYSQTITVEGQIEIDGQLIQLN